MLPGLPQRDCREPKGGKSGGKWILSFQLFLIDLVARNTMALSVLLYDAPLPSYRGFCADPSSRRIGTKLGMPTLGVFWSGLSEFCGAQTNRGGLDHDFVQLIFIGDSYSPPGPQHDGVVRFSKLALFREILTFLWWTPTFAYGYKTQESYPWVVD